MAMNYTSHQYLNLEMMSEGSRIDKTIQFNSLKSGAKPTDMNAIQLNKSYVAVNSCIDSNSMSGLPLVPGQNTKFATYHHPHNIHVSFFKFFFLIEIQSLHLRKALMRLRIK